MAGHSPNPYVKTLIESHRMCRTAGHQWDVFNDFFSQRPQFGFLLSLRCIRCGTIRNDVVDAYGYTIGRRYRYAPGYQFMDMEGEVPERADFKLYLAQEHGESGVLEED